ncbi:MAG: FAD-binding protein, partial [Gaiellales bacterium]
ELLTAESGAIIAQLIEQSACAELSGLEHYTGIPSTLGGALWQNLHFLAPCRTRTMFIEEVVDSARVLLEDGTITEVDCAWFEFGYDDSVLHHARHIVLDASLRLTPAPREQIEQVRTANQAWRDEKHPTGAVSASAGSIFQKLEGIGAGRLIDAAGLKGHQIGGAIVSPHHANFIMNAGGATAADVQALIAHVQSEVERTSGHRLETEITLIGSFSS